MPLCFCKNDGHELDLVVLSRDETSITLSVLTPVEQYDEDQIINDWQDIEPVLKTKVNAGGVDNEGYGALVSQIPEHQGQVFFYKGKITFDLTGDRGVDELIDYSVVDILVDEQGKPSHWLSRFTDTIIGKVIKSARYREIKRSKVIATIVMPFKTSSLDEVRVEVKYNKFKPLGLTEDEIVTLEQESADVAAYNMPFFATHLWTIEDDLNGETKAPVGEFVNIPIGVKMVRGGASINKSVKLYLKTNCGYLPYSSIVTDTNGRGIIKFSTLGLQPGDVAEIKVGTPIFTCISKIKVEVV